MALVLRFSVVENYGALGATFQDLTGDYSATNLGGWSAPNADRNDTLEANLTITPINLDTLEEETSYPVIDLLARSGVPVNGTASLVPTDFGQVDDDTKIPAGIYKFVWDTVEDEMAGEIPYSATWYGFYTNGLLCCEMNALIALDTCDCCKLTEQKKNILLMSLMLAAVLGNQTNCQNVSDAAKQIGCLQTLCSALNGDCGCGCGCGC